MAKGIHGNEEHLPDDLIGFSPFALFLMIPSLA